MFFITLQKLPKRKVGLNWDADDKKQNAINGIRILPREIEKWLKKKSKGISKHCRYIQS